MQRFAHFTNFVNWRSRKAVVYFLIGGALFIIVAGIEFLRLRNERFDAGIRRQGGSVKREQRLPTWIGGDLIRPFAKWLEPVTPAEVRISVIEPDSRRMEELRAIRGLTELTIWDNRLSSSDLIRLRGFDSLEELDVRSRNFTDEWVDSLPVLPRLKRLRLSQCPVTSEVLGKLEKYAERLPNKPLVVDLFNTSATIARQVDASFPSSARVGLARRASVQFQLNRALPANYGMAILLNTRTPKAHDSFERVGKGVIRVIPANDRNQYQLDSDVAFGSAGPAEWQVALCEVPYGNLKVSCTIAEGKIAVEPAKPASQVTDDQ